MNPNQHHSGDTTLNVFCMLLGLMGSILATVMDYLPAPKEFWPAVAVAASCAAVGFFTTKILHFVWNKFLHPLYLKFIQLWQ